jgi:hypothetical protein
MIGLILVAPLLQSSPLRSDDGALHIYRTVALDRAIRDGVLYPRWFPDLAFGYGFPFFNYREPLSYYALEVEHLIGLSIPLALNLLLAGSVILGGLAILWWVSDIFDQRAGFLAGVIYMAAPYILIGPIERANLPEVIALGLMPLILFFFRRLIVIGGRKYFIAAVVAYSAFMLTHNISSLIFTPILTAYCLLRIPNPSLRLTQRAIRRALFAIILSLALTAFFWLPALAEGNSVQLYLTHSTRGNDYHFNFLSLGELFDVKTSDPNLLNPPEGFMLGWPQIVLAVWGLVAVRRTASRDQRAHSIAALAAALGFIFMTLPVSLPVWDNLPLIRFVQFPWRFVGRAMLPMSLLGGAALYQLQTRWPRIGSFALVGSLASGVLIFATPWSYPPASPIKNDLTINDVFAFEHDSGLIGVDPVGAYLPLTVQQRPAGSPLEIDYASSGSIRRFDRSVLPTGASISREIYGPNRAAIDLDSPIGFRATYLTFDFPGWQVSIDQQPATIIPSDPTGLITFDIPAGQHHVDVSFGSTPVRSIADVISLAAGLIFAVALIRFNFQPVSVHNPAPSFSGSHPLPLLLIPIAFILIKSTLIDAQLTPLRSTRLVNDQIAGVSYPLHIDFGGQMRLLGYDLLSATASSSESVRLHLYWRALTPMNTEYRTTVGLIDDRGEIWSPKSVDRPRGYRDYPLTTQWPTTAYVMDSFDLPINPGTPPGAYTLFVEVFDLRTLVPLPVQAGVPHPPGRSSDATLTSIEVTRPSRAVPLDQLNIYNLKLDRAIAPDLKLLGVNRDRDDAMPGDTVLLTFFWQATQQPRQDYALQIELIDPNQQVVLAHDFPLGYLYPTSRWTNGDQIVDLDRVRVPLNAATGAYHWRATLTQQAAIDLGGLKVTAPDRSFAMPSIQNRIDQTFEDKVTLLGYRLDGQAVRGQDLKVTLYWRAENEMDVSYKVFIHLLKPDGRPVAQVDAMPMNGSRPTIGWLPGEILTDTYTLSVPADLPAGEYVLTTGLYNEDDVGRLRLATGADRIDLTTIDIAP